MTEITFIEPSGTSRVLDVADGITLMQAATINGVSGIEAECGGSCSCATCHCYMEGAAAEALPAVGEGENALLDFTTAERRDNSRLSCQVLVTPALAGLVVRVAESQS